MKNVFVIGAGQLGSRHLQALKSIRQNLEINIIDPNKESLKVAKERYDSIPGNQDNRVFYKQSINNIDATTEIDIVIIATTSNVRAKITKDLLEKFEVKSIVFEKILFQKREDYFAVSDLLKKKNVKGYVNCCMRMMSFYNEIKSSFKDTKFKYLVSGSQYGLVTNLIHYIDHMAYLNNSTHYTANSNFLDENLIESKRKGFYELNGTFHVNFNNGTQGIFTCEPEGDSPIIIQAYNNKVHFISKESEGKVLISKSENDWKWEEIEFNIPFQSELTTNLIEELFQKDTCSLPSYEESKEIHLPLLDSLLDFINKKDEASFDLYPFT